MAQPTMSDGVAASLGIGTRDLVAFVGAGGKSTLMLASGMELVHDGRPVVLGTTTKMGPDQIPEWAVVCRTAAEALAALADGSPAFLLGSIEGHKVVGVAPELVGDVWATGMAAVLIEADGARRRSFKAPEGHEPVIPAPTTVVVVVAGMDAVGGRIGDVCHRPDRVAELIGKSVDQRLEVPDVVTVLRHPAGGLARIPVHARVVVALTRGAEDVAQVVRDHLATERRIDRIVRFAALPDLAG